jgi:hypothetical protein
VQNLIVSHVHLHPNPFFLIIRNTSLFGPPLCVMIYEYVMIFLWCILHYMSDPMYVILWCKTETLGCTIQKLLLYFKLYPSAKFDSLSCSLTSKSFLSNYKKHFTFWSTTVLFNQTFLLFTYKKRTNKSALHEITEILLKKIINLCTTLLPQKKLSVRLCFFISSRYLTKYIFTPSVFASVEH